MPELVGLQSALFFESPEEIYRRVFRDLKPRTPTPTLRVEFCRFANPDSFIRLENGRLHVRISDLLEGAPAGSIDWCETAAFVAARPSRTRVRITAQMSRTS